MKKLKYLLLSFSVLLTEINLSAHSSKFSDQADVAFHQKKYEEAIQLYSQAIQQGDSTIGVYYNLGNAYYRTNQYAEATYAYKKALLIEPADSDTQYNLSLALSKLPSSTVDRKSIKNKTFDWIFFRLYKSTLCLLGYSTFFLFLITGLGYILFSDSKKRKYSFYIAGIFLLTNLYLDISLVYQEHYSAHTHEAMIAETTIDIFHSAGDEKPLYKLQKGDILTITGKQQDAYTEIKTPDGRIGWVYTNNIIRI